ncbi:MAG TPA: PAS domain S-box protein, partial [Opitutaceae bacterium]|nr:PAS domain S-box protein [Opitutaceae bacterium]
MPRTARASTLALLALVVATVSAPAADRARGDLRKVRLRLPYSHQFQFAGAYAAQANGLFRARGLEVEIVSSRSQAASPIEDVLGGRADFGILQGPQLVSARMDGRPVVILAAIMQHSPQALVVRADSGLRTPHDLVGKRVALDQTSLVSEVRVMFEREGIPFEQVTLVENRWDRNELQTGEADAMSTFVIDGPYIFRQQGLPVNVIRPVDYGVDFYGDCLFTREELLERDRPLAEAVRAALLEGWTAALRDPAEVVDWIVANLPDRPDYATREMMLAEAREMKRLINADLVELGHMNAGRWRAMAQGLDPAADDARLRRLQGFLYEEAPPASPVLRWIWWGLVAALVVALLSLLANRRLHRLAERRTSELRSKEEHYRLLFERSPVALVEFDYRPLRAWFAELRARGVTDLAAHFAADPAARDRAIALSPLREVNPAAVRAVGARSREEMFARLPEIVTPGSVEARLHNMARLWQGLDDAEGEIPYRDLSTGEIRYFYYHWQMPRGPDGSLTFENTQTALLDVTEKRRAEEAVRESEERYRRLFEATPVPMWIYDLEDLRFLAVNDATVRNYGYSREEFLGMSIMDIRPPEERARLQRVISDYRGGQPHRNDIWRHQRKDGSILFVEVYAHTVGLQGRRGVLVVPFDLTEKLRAEQALRESEARYRELFENAAGGVYRSTPEGRFIAVNPALARMLGFDSPEQMMARYGDRLETDLYVKPGRRGEFAAQLGGGDTVMNFESEVHGGDGRSRWISESVRAVRDGAGRLLYYEGFVADLTPRRQLEQELQRASKLEAVGILAGGIAHDFNNIL